MLTLRLAAQSLINRRLTSVLTLLSVALSVALLIGVERVRQGARDSFANTISQTDLIVGAKGGPIQLLLYTVFRMGSATANISYQTYQEFASHPAVSWTIPYSLGDSHRGFRVVGTSAAFYNHYRYRRGQSVEFASGGKAEGVFDAVIGSDVAKALGYKLGDEIVLTHGVTDGASFQDHGDKPFQVTGVLERTATPIDRSIYVTLEGIEAIHMDWADGAPPREGEAIPASAIKKEEVHIDQITAFLVGTKNRFEVLRLQREINVYPDEPIMAIIPGVALSELWEGISYAEGGLQVVSAFVVLVGLLGMLVSIYNSLNERRREMAILRSVGAGPWLIFSLLVLESLLLTVGGAAVGTGLLYGLMIVLQPLVEHEFGLYIPISPLQIEEYIYLGCVILLGVILGAIPAWRAYRNTLYDGLTIRI